MSGPQTQAKPDPRPTIAWYASWRGQPSDEPWAGCWATREKAIERAPAELDLEPGEEYEIGRGVKSEIPGVDAGLILEQLAEDNETPECWEPWRAPRAAVLELERQLNKVIAAWLEHEGLTLDWVDVVDVETHTVPARTPEEDRP